jgi:glycosyltransferase involved in cell wall biosynthesis
MSRADLVVTDAIELYRERAALHPHVVRIPSGVTPWPEGSARPPEWARGLPRPVIGYLGSIDHRIDLRLVEAVARRHPGWSVVLVGPVTDISVEALRRLPNVHLHAQVPDQEVPSVLAAFDVGVMPYAGIEMTRFTYPAKLHQYFAAGLPIASPRLPDLEEFAGLVETGDGERGFACAVSRAAVAPDRAAERRYVASRNTWEARHADLLEAIRAVLPVAPVGT